MANVNTDLTEEDAAALQFPKETPSVSSVQRIKQTHRPSEKCSFCAGELRAPYILCAVCDVPVCTACFANGAEFGAHKNDHSYRVMNDEFVLFEGSDWTAREELLLLDSILQHNNWGNIAKLFEKRSESEIKAHYDYYYLSRKGSEALPEIPEVERGFPKPIVPYRFKVSGLEEPPRYSSSSPGYNLVAGYNAARSDFELEYDVNAEDMVSNLSLDVVDKDDPNYELISDLQCCIVMGYNRRLMERQRRKKIIRRHGLILQRKTTAAFQRYDVTITRPVCERLMKFMQYFKSGMEFDYMMEGLHRAGELKLQISRLCELRKLGITTKRGINLYLKLKQGHEASLKELQAFRARPEYSINLRNVSPKATTSKKRSGFTPIDIIGMPGYEKLQPNEMELCKNVRLVPMTYLELKEILIAENKKLGHLKLQTARRLLKIDVNKTRRLYDFLVQEGYLKKP